MNETLAAIVAHGEILLFFYVLADQLGVQVPAAPVLMSLWWVALQHGGNIITGDRWQDLLQSIVATPTSLASLLLGRITTVMCLGLLSFFEVWAIGELMFGVSLSFEHPLELVLILLCTAFATAGASVAFASLFVMTRNAYTFTNSAGFPLYLLSGVFVPVAVLPGWIYPLSTLIFMSWSADLLRASVKPGEIDDFWPRLAMVVFLGAVSFALGKLVLDRVLRKMRTTGELATA